MKIELTKNIFGELHIDDKDLVGVYGPSIIDRPPLDSTDISNKLKTPVGCKPIPELAKGKRNVVIVTDDNTRLTPVNSILSVVLDELRSGGIKEESITILIGLGTHRPMTEQEIHEKFGKEIAEKYKIVNHQWHIPDALTSIGNCDTDFEIVINKLILEADLILTIGSIVPHATAGFSGGGKTIMPGVCGERTIEYTHWMALDYAMNEILGRFDNPIRRAIDNVAKTFPLKMMINTILFNGSNIYDIVAGSLEQAFQAAVDSCKEVYGVTIPHKADIVIAEAYPTDIDLRQAIKAICSADIVCRDNGVIILPAECTEGIAPQFPEFVEYGFRNPDALYRSVNNGEYKNKLLAYTLVAIGRIISKRVKAILVTPNISKDEIHKMGFISAGNLDEAYEIAKKNTPHKADVIVLKQAGEILPVLQEN